MFLCGFVYWYYYGDVCISGLNVRLEGFGGYVNEEVKFFLFECGDGRGCYVFFGWSEYSGSYGFC